MLLLHSYIFLKLGTPKSAALPHICVTTTVTQMTKRPPGLVLFIYLFFNCEKYDTVKTTKEEEKGLKHLCPQM